MNIPGMGGVNRAVNTAAQQHGEAVVRSAVSNTKHKVLSSDFGLKPATAIAKSEASERTPATSKFGKVAQSANTHWRTLMVTMSGAATGGMAGAAMPFPILHNVLGGVVGAGTGLAELRAGQKLGLIDPEMSKKTQYTHTALSGAAGWLVG